MAVRLRYPGVDHREVAGSQQNPVASSLWPSRRGSGGPVWRRFSQRQEHVMKLDAAQLERTTTQLQAEVIPEDHPLIPQLNRMFGDHTYLLDSNGLIIVEPAAAELAPDTAGMGRGELGELDRLESPKLEAHEPELTESMVALETDGGS